MLLAERAGRCLHEQVATWAADLRRSPTAPSRSRTIGSAVPAWWLQRRQTRSAPPSPAPMSLAHLRPVAGLDSDASSWAIPRAALAEVVGVARRPSPTARTRRLDTGAGPRRCSVSSLAQVIVGALRLGLLVSPTGSPTFVSSSQPAISDHRPSRLLTDAKPANRAHFDDCRIPIGSGRASLAPRLTAAVRPCTRLGPVVLRSPGVPAPRSAVEDDR